MESFGFILFFSIIGAIILFSLDKIMDKKMTPEERKAARQKIRDGIALKEKLEKWGYISPALICPHCQQKGFVSTLPVKRKKGVSGAKATAALLTLGVSMLATGLSRKEGLTQAHCEKCGSTWDF